MLRYSFLFVLLTFALICNSQTTNLDSTNRIKEAPENLKKIIENIKEKYKSENEDYLEIDGLVIDNTKTKSGRDFYNHFFNNWESPAKAKNFSIYISEKPYRLSTTKIEVKLNETMVFQSFLQPRISFIENVAESAVERTRLYLINYEEIERQLESDDQTGTGIY